MRRLKLKFQNKSNYVAYTTVMELMRICGNFT